MNYQVYEFEQSFTNDYINLKNNIHRKNIKLSSEVARI